MSTEMADQEADLGVEIGGVGAGVKVEVEAEVGAGAGLHELDLVFNDTNYDNQVFSVQYGLIRRVIIAFVSY